MRGGRLKGGVMRVGVMRVVLLGGCLWGAWSWWGCGPVGDSIWGPKASEVSEGRRMPVRMRLATGKAATTRPATTRPADPGVGEESKAGEEGASAILKPPYTLNTVNIIRLVYQASPSVTASREEKVAAQHGLREFKTNLSRFEPFVETNANASRFPRRRGAEGRTGEVVGGIEKETFEGALLRLEGGASTSRVEYEEYDEQEGEDHVDEGSGALVRARVEVPFVGSRRRQERVISQAYQESTARKAELDYVSNYRTFATTAMTYYWTALLYLNYARAYEQQLFELESLKNDRRTKADDVPRLESTAASSRSYRDEYHAYYKDAVTSLVAALGIGPDEAYTLEEPTYVPSPYIKESSTAEGRQRMMEAAYENNPKFRVLTDAIKDAELQRALAIAGKLDVTAYVEGTQFPFGAETYDDRVEGWQILGGVTVRLNDQRVLNASRMKAEAMIRQYRAQIDAEQLEIQREIVTETDKLRSNDEVRHQILDVIRKKRAEFVDRSTRYLEGQEEGLSIDDVIRPLTEMTTGEVRLASNTYYSGLSERSLMGATGEVYRLVGMKVENGGRQAGGGASRSDDGEGRGQ